MSHWLYLCILVFSICGMLLLDRKYTVAFWDDWRRTGLTLGVTIAFFVVWDFAGIALRIFFSGGSPYALPFMLLPEFPVEELFFLFLLCYLTLLLYRGGERGYRHVRRS